MSYLGFIGYHRFPTGGSLTPGGRNVIFEDESLYILGCTLLQNSRDL